MTEGAMITDSELREMLAAEMWKEGEPALSGTIRNGSDNSRGGNAALAAMRAVSQAAAERCAKIADELEREGKARRSSKRADNGERAFFDGFANAAGQLASGIRSQIPQERRKETASDWIEWNGGDCPVSSATRVTYKTRNGYVGKNIPASDLYWHHDLLNNEDAQDHIIAYKKAAVQSPQPQESGRGEGGRFDKFSEDKATMPEDFTAPLDERTTRQLMREAREKATQPHPTCDCLGVLVEAIREVAALQDIDVASNRNVLWRLADSLAGRGKTNAS